MDLALCCVVLCCVVLCVFFFFVCFFCQAEDGIRDLVRSRGLGDVYKRQFQTEPVTSDNTFMVNTSICVNDKIVNNFD